MAILEVAGSKVKVINCYVRAEKNELVFFNTLKLWMPGRIPTILVGRL